MMEKMTKKRFRKIVSKKQDSAGLRVRHEVTFVALKSCSQHCRESFYAPTIISTS